MKSLLDKGAWIKGVALPARAPMFCRTAGGGS